MKNYKKFYNGLIMILILMNAMPLFGQNSTIEKKWDTEGFFGLGARLTPIYLNYNDYSGNLEEQNTLSGLSLISGLNFTHKKSGMGFSLSSALKRDLLFTKLIPTNADCMGCQKFIEEPYKDWMADLHFGVYKYFPIGKNSLKVELGYSFMNIGSGYNTINYNSVDRQIDYQDISSNYEAFYADVSYRMRNVSFGVRVQYAPNSNLSYGNSLLSIEGRFIYHFGSAMQQNKNRIPKSVSSF